MKHALPTFKLNEIINLEQYPINDLSTRKGRELIQDCRQQLKDYSCFVIRNFITPYALSLAQQEAQLLAPLGYGELRYTNPYRTSDDPSLPSDHPVRCFMERTNAFVAKDQFKPNSFFLALYREPSLKTFVEACLGHTIYEFNDPLAGVSLNVLRPGTQHPWHFDAIEFNLSLMVQTAKESGIFEYAPLIRTSKQENYEVVSQVLSGRYSNVQQIDLQPSDLMLIQGRYSLHRVTRVLGDRDRYSVVFSYSTNNNAIGSVEYSQALFGRTTSKHHA